MTAQPPRREDRSHAQPRAGLLQAEHGEHGEDRTGAAALLGAGAEGGVEPARPCPALHLKISRRAFQVGGGWWRHLGRWALAEMLQAVQPGPDRRGPGPERVSGISCVGKTRTQGVQRCPAANSLPFRMPFLINCWTGRTREQPLNPDAILDALKKALAEADAER